MNLVGLYCKNVKLRLRIQFLKTEYKLNSIIIIIIIIIIIGRVIYLYFSSKSRWNTEVQLQFNFAIPR